ncbi:hypothetical protein I314_00420 [Cryptococcus bacillisporus CA1873]|uniref:Unplaced genomic scaffold supercont1.5, whole genome shotgun sequence n=2 Tax=Cryptococcus gattii TaxID=552467 RepID=A0A0D0VMJ9_CRYGA|nr:hypothetical protein I312_02381 [Cryptococcus bacillisporus CA1280]KIR69310.1 hypothetical protein I314_00420 [Cryptococcus bacillisporus CA1873]|eukprot:KIR69310.1 hypothetical protein I314_00420 [Cryptococcus gattii CA1873]
MSVLLQRQHRHPTINQSFQPWAERAQEKGKSRVGSLHQQLPYFN